MGRHLLPKPIPIPSFFQADINLGKMTELDYYKNILPYHLIKEFVEDLNSNMWIKDIIKKWQAKLK